MSSTLLLAFVSCGMLSGKVGLCFAQSDNWIHREYDQALLGAALHSSQVPEEPPTAEMFSSQPSIITSGHFLRAIFQ